jgi:PAS domain S-box-containing protein
MAFSVRPDGCTDFVSGSWQEYSGFSLEATTGGGWHATVHPDDLDRHLEKWRASLEGGEPFVNEVRHRSAQGEYRWFLVRAVPLRDAQGRNIAWKVGELPVVMGDPALLRQVFVNLVLNAVDALNGNGTGSS